MVAQRCLLVLCTLALAVSTFAQEPQNAASKSKVDHVLLISIDGMHASDLSYLVKNRPQSAIAKLANSGVVYTNTLGSRPSDSFPGLAAFMTGGSFRSHGLLYDNSWDFSLYDPKDTMCKTPGGANALYDESIEIDDTRTDGGGGIDTAKLPRRLVKVVDPKTKKETMECQPVYPNQRVRVNNIFEVAREAGRVTAWSDKHFAYQWLQGPSGAGVTDLHNIEITGVPNSAGNYTDCFKYDVLKTPVVLDWINGLNSFTKKTQGVPAIFGVNYQTVSVAQKTEPNGGYVTPLPTAVPNYQLGQAYKLLDDQIAIFVKQIAAKGLTSRTAIIISAKHGQSPVGFKANKIDDALVTAAVTAAVKTEPAFVTADDVALIFLKDYKNIEKIVAYLTKPAVHQQLQISQIIYGDRLIDEFGDYRTDPRVPHIIIVVKPGVIYTTSASKTAEHGGFGATDNRVGLLVSGPFGKKTISQPVETKQVAPSILSMLGLNPYGLKAVRLEDTKQLPGLN